MKIDKDVEFGGNNVASHQTPRTAGRVPARKSGSPHVSLRLRPEDLLVGWDAAFDHDDEELALLSEQADGRESGRSEPWNTDEEVLREFHLAVTHPGSRSLSGRML